MSYAFPSNHDIITPADLHNYEALDNECCFFQFPHNGVGDPWLLDRRAIPRSPSTEKLLNVMNQVVIQAKTVKTAAKDKDVIYRQDVMKTIEAAIDGLSSKLRNISMSIHSASTLMSLTA